MKVIDDSGIEKVLWSIAIPGFGQILNKKYFKGIVLIILEFLINVKSSINTAIVLSFLGQTELAVEVSNYEWLLYYPCVHIFGIWDAYRDAVDEVPPLLYIPFATSAYSETIGVVYSKILRVNGVLLGPIFLPLICIFVGIGIGLIVRCIIFSVIKNKNKL